jgi:hypothetical protein
MVLLVLISFLTARTFFSHFDLRVTSVGNVGFHLELESVVRRPLPLLAHCLVPAGGTFTGNLRDVDLEEDCWRRKDQKYVCPVGPTSLLERFASR